MANAQGKSLDRKKLFADPILITAIIGIFLFLLLFIVYPLAILLTDSAVVETTVGETTKRTIGFDNFIRIFKMSTFRQAISNTLFLGLVSGIGATLLGFLFAYVDSYVDVGSKIVRKLFGMVSVLPVVSPPFVLSLSAIL
ncbi:MAG: sugar ABC transporter permease, partial [Spirochaetaceae bacterium]|nr:sugar ABC transporter permease [Spirochaetaceae bacterium]